MILYSKQMNVKKGIFIRIKFPKSCFETLQSPSKLKSVAIHPVTFNKDLFI